MPVVKKLRLSIIRTDVITPSLTLTVQLPHSECNSHIARESNFVKPDTL